MVQLHQLLIFMCTFTMIQNKTRTERESRNAPPSVCGLIRMIDFPPSLASDRVQKWQENEEIIKELRPFIDNIDNILTPMLAFDTG